MFERLGRFVVYRRWWVIAAWLVAAVALGAFAPSLSDATTQDQADFLPGRYESVQATALAQQAFGQVDGATATIVVKRDDGGPLTTADQATVAKMTQAVTDAHIDKVTGAVTGPQAVSPNKLVQLVTSGSATTRRTPR